jgi:hypothetical protein
LLEKPRMLSLPLPPRMRSKLAMPSFSPPAPPVVPILAAKIGVVRSE